MDGYPYYWQFPVNVTCNEGAATDKVSVPIQNQPTGSRGMQPSRRQETGNKRDRNSSDKGPNYLERYACGLQTALEEKMKEIELWKLKLEDSERRSKQITSKMALKMDDGECFENVNDEFSNYNVATKFQTLYNTEWVQLVRLLKWELPNMEELQRIERLSKIMQCAYKECKSTAEKQIRKFLYLDDNEDLPSEEELKEIMSYRREFGVKNYVREKVKRKVFEIVNSTEEAKEFYVEENKKKVEEEMKDFFFKFIDYCWIIAISHPPIVLNFDVVGKQYEEIKEYFTEFSTKKAVEDPSKTNQSVVVVVWPSVELKDETKYYTRGDVILVKKGKAFDETDDPLRMRPFSLTSSVSLGPERPYEVFELKDRCHFSTDV